MSPIRAPNPPMMIEPARSYLASTVQPAALSDEKILHTDGHC